MRQLPRIPVQRILSGFHPKHLENPRRALGVVILIAFVIAFLSWFHVWFALSISGEIVAEAVTLTLPDGLAIEPGLPLDARQSLRLGGYTTNEGLPASGQANLRNPRATELAELDLAPHGVLSLTLHSVHERRLLQLLASHGASIAVDLMQPIGDFRADEGPELVRASAAPGDGTPLRLQATLGGPRPGDAKLWPRLQDLLGVERADSSTQWADQFAITDVAVADLGFGRENDNQAGPAFVSSVVSGQIILVDTEKTLRLNPAAPLVLGGFRGRVSELMLRNDGFHVLFSGKVDNLTLGPIGFPADQRPTMLDYVLSNPLSKAILATAAWAAAIILPSLYGLAKLKPLE